ncbi:MAG TPA: prolyl oligopeptidase family serine peptidase, partial [Gemmatimonadales bacterium]
MTPLSAVRSPTRYPPARRADVVDDFHGTRIADPYRWLEAVDAPETRAWIEAENRVTEAFLNAVPARDAIRRRLTELWDYPRFGTPFHKAGRWFFWKNDGLQAQAVLYHAGELDGEPAVLLDPNTLSADGTVAITTAAVSEDAALVAYARASAGSDWNEILVRDVATGRDRPDLIRWVKFSEIAWTHDGAGFFYSRYPTPADGAALLAANTHHALYYHRLGTDQRDDLLIFERPDEPDWGVAAEVSADGRYLVLHLWVGTDRRNRIYVADLRDPARPHLQAPVGPLLDAFDAGYGYVANEGTRFFFATDHDAPRRRLIALELADPAPAAWRAVIPEQPETLESVRLVGGTFIASYLVDAHARLRRFTREGTPLADVPLPALGTLGAVAGEPDDPDLFFAFTSHLYPTTIFRHTVATGRTEVWRAPRIAFDPAPFETQQVWYESADGTRIPMFVTGPRRRRPRGETPVYLYGYGGFNVSMTPTFSPGVLVWLELGGAFAMPALRGGGEYGESWHQAGMLERKQNVFDDFIAAAEHLVDSGVTVPARLAIGGGSNGGLLVGAVLTQRPDLFGAAVPAVGVMD